MTHPRSRNSKRSRRSAAPFFLTLRHYKELHKQKQHNKNRKAGS